MWGTKIKKTSHLRGKIRYLVSFFSSQQNVRFLVSFFSSQQNVCFIVSFFEAIPFKTKFELTVFEIKKASRYKFRAMHFLHSRTQYSILMTFRQSEFEAKARKQTFDWLWLCWTNFTDFKLIGLNFYFHLINQLKLKLWSSSKVLGSRSKGRGFDPRPMLDGNGVKAMPGWLLVPGLLPRP